MWGPVGLALECYCGYGNRRSFGERRFERIVLRFTRFQPQTPSIVVDHDADVIRVVERLRGAVEGGLVELPSRGCEPPNESAEVAPVFAVAALPPLGRKVVLIPPGILGLRR